MVDGWVTGLLVAFGILVAVVGVFAYFRMISATSSDRPSSKREEVLTDEGRGEASSQPTSDKQD